jgi:two-component system nitrogen regulation sensor histidine kinase GlnL
MRSLMTAVIALNEALDIVYMNPAAETLLGISERQAAGRNLEGVLQPARELAALCRRALDEGVTIGLKEYATGVAGQELVLDCRARPMEERGGLVLELEDTMLDRQVRAEADLAARQQLSRRIVKQLAHEVKNPLGGMRGAAQLLERQLVSEDQKRYTRVIISEADRLAALVDSILTAGSRANPAECNLHEITEQVANLVDAEKPASVELVRDYDPSLPPLVVDKDQMIQALLNLARNALQALGGEGRLVLRTRALSNITVNGELYRVVLSAEVEDDGPGIPQELRETVFYPLVSGRPDGTGLGLTIAQHLVSANGGLIELVSRPGRTIFKLRLPAGKPVTAGSDAGGRP